MKTTLNADFFGGHDTQSFTADVGYVSTSSYYSLDTDVVLGIRRAIAPSQRLAATEAIDLVLGRVIAQLNETIASEEEVQSWEAEILTDDNAEYRPPRRKYLDIPVAATINSGRKKRNYTAEDHQVWS